MLSSSDVSAMFAQQQQMFMGQNQFAQQIGIPNPSMSLAAWGTNPSQRAFGAQGTFGGHSPVSYAPGGMGGPGYGGGSRLAGGAMSAMGGIGSAASMLAFDPISAFARGGGFAPSIFGSGGMSGGIGAMAGGGIMGGMAAAAPPMMAMMAAQKYIGAFAGGGQQQQAIQSSLGGFGFQNAQSRTGQGFSRDDAQMIGTQVRAISHIPEMMTSVEELTKLIPKLKSSGVMAGVRDASEFNSRFKDAVKTLREVSKVMGSTMEEASQFFEHSRSVGFLGRKDQLKNAMNVQFTAAQTGMSSQQVMQLQQGGAQMAVGRGIRRKTGAEAVTNIAQQFGRGLETGDISQADLEDMTGVSGEGAVAAASTQIADKLARFAEGSSAGRLSMMALSDFDSKTGKLIGINTKLAQKYARGEVSKDELMQRLSGLTRDQKIAASRKTGTMAMEFAGATGPGGAMAFMSNVLGERGYGEEASKFQMQKYGFSEVDVDVMSQMQGVGVGGGGQRQKAFERKRKMEADISERTDPSKIMARIGTKLHTGLGLAAAEQEGSKMFSFIGKAWDEFVDDAVGRYSVQLSEEGARRMTDSFRSGQGRKQLADIFGKAMGGPRFSLAGKAGTLSKMMGTALNPAALLFGSQGVEAAGLGVQGAMQGAAQMFSGAGRESIGDDPTRQRDFLRKQFGAAGDTTASTSARFKELRGMGAGATAARSSMQDVISKLDAKGEFSAAGEEDKIRMIQEEMGGEGSSAFMQVAMPGVALYQEARKMYQERKYGAAMKFMADKKLSKAEAAVALTDRIKDPSFGEASLRDVMKSSAEDIRAAQVNLKSQLGDEEGTAIAGIMAVGGKASDVILAMTSGDEKGKAIRDIMDSGMSSDEKQAKLKELGHDVSVGELDRIQETHRTIAAATRQGDPEERAKKANQIREALMGVQGANARKDQAMAFQALEDAAEKVQSGPLKEAMLGLGKTKVSRREGESEDEYTARVSTTQKGKLDELHKQLASYSERMIQTGGKGKEKEREALIKELGPEMADIVLGATKGGSRKGIRGGSGTRADFAKSLGLKESDLGDFMEGDFAGGKASWTAEQALKAKAAASSGGALGDIIGAKEKHDKSPEGRAEKLNKTLDNLNTTMAKTNTLLAIQGGMSKEEAEKKYAQSEESKEVNKPT